MKRFIQEHGQTTVEYALVLLAAAAVAIVLITWATNDGALSDFFSKIMQKILRNAQ